jgi:magnesium chelatase subunit D
MTSESYACWRRCPTKLMSLAPRRNRTELPLTALVALDEPRLALLLLAVEPRLRGVLWAGPAGSGKSAMLEGYRALRPHTPVFNLPLGADEESLIGGIDLEATLQRGERVLRQGLIAKAHGGALMVDSCHLLADSAVNVLMSALDQGQLQIEREGVSLQLASDFVLLATYDPAEGQPRAHLMDRVGLVVPMPALKETTHRESILRRHLGAHQTDWDDELELLQQLVKTAREYLPEVTLSDAQAKELSTAALALGIEGHRADLFAQHAARASAALALRDTVDSTDLQVALRFVLLPRATRMPATAAPPNAEEYPPQGPTPTDPSPNGPDNANDALHDPPASDDHNNGQAELPNADALTLEQAILEAAETQLPAVLERLAFAHSRHSAGGSRGSTEGTRGRHVGSRPGELRDGKIDLLATLRAASRWQRLRQGTRRVKITLDDLRIKTFRSKAGALFIFAVDASGSMALNRMRQAKGAVHALLEQAYVNRDRVALLSFRQQQADILLPPTNSVELLRRAVDQLPTGGGTPIAAALITALELAEQAKRRGCHQVVLVLLTDGRANIGLRATRQEVDNELHALARHVASRGIQSMVIDTQRNFLSQGAAQKLAQGLDGQYLYLPGAKGEAIAAAIRQGGMMSAATSTRRAV